MPAYWPPDYIGFDILNNDDVNGPFIDDETLSSFNAEFKSEYLMNWLVS